MIIDKNEISEKLRKLKKLISERQVVVSGVLVEGNTLYATNYNIGIKVKLDIEESGERFIIPIKAIDLIAALPDGDVEITGDDTAVEIKCGKIRNKVKTYSTSDFIFMQGQETRPSDSAVISGIELTSAINSVMYAVPDESLKMPTLEGICFEAAEGTLNIAGSDGKRLAWKRVKYDGAFKLIVPKPAVKRALEIGFNESVTIDYADSWIRFTSGDYEISSRLLEGEYLDYKKLFNPLPYACTLNTRALTDCLKRVLICASEKQDIQTPVIFNFLSNGGLAVSLHKGDTVYEEDVELAHPLDTDIRIGFNGRFFLDALSSFDNKDVTLELTNSISAAVMRQGELAAMVLPVRLY